ncbi:MAG: hypothetical protein ACP5O2_02900 [Bacteroidales bacterium]
MRKIIVLLLFSGMTIAQIMGQEKTKTEPEFLFSREQGISISGFGGPITEFSGIDGSFGVSVGGGGAVLINQMFFFGGYGQGLTTDQPRYSITLMQGDNALAYSNLRPQIGHGGFWLGYIHPSHKIFHWALSTKIGWGGITYSQGSNENNIDELGTDGIFVLTPQAEIEINLFTWFKLNLGVGYRYVGGLDAKYNTPEGLKPLMSSGALNSPVGSIALMFGNFVK